MSGATVVHRKALYRITDAIQLLSIGRTTFYEELRTGRIRTVGEGRNRRVPAAAIDEYVKLREDEA